LVVNGSDDATRLQNGARGGVAIVNVSTTSPIMVPRKQPHAPSGAFIPTFFAID